VNAAGNQRLRKVQGTTVRKELGALRRFLKWCEARGFMPRAVVVPGVNSKALGTNFGKRRRQKAADLSPQEIERLLAALPEWSTSRKVKPFPIRARFLVQYDTGSGPRRSQRSVCPSTTTTARSN
jgi:integrase